MEATMAMVRTTAITTSESAVGREKTSDRTIFTPTKVMLIVLCDGHKSTNKLQQKIVFWMHFYFLMKPHSYSREDQKGSKQVDNPIERLDECHTNSNERATHKERTQDAPVEHPVLVGRWHLEVGE